MTEMHSVSEEKKRLQAKLNAKEPIPEGTIQKVNPFSRLDLMKDKTREFTKALEGKISTEEIQKMIDVYDLLATDWVYSNVLEWDGSMPDLQIKKILRLF